MAIGSEWTESNIKPEQLVTQIGQAFGWTFYEHPIKGDEAPLLAYRTGYRVWDTQDYDIPENL